MKLDLKFYTTLRDNILPSNSEADKGKIVFDHVKGRIGANGAWFGDSSDKLPLGGGKMTGTITRTYETASDSPMLSLESTNQDVWLWRIKDTATSTATATSKVYGFGLKYLGTGTGNNNSLALYADNQAGTQVQAFTMTQDGNITLSKNLTVSGVTTIPTVSGNVNMSNGVITWAGATAVNGASLVLNGRPILIDGGETTNSTKRYAIDYINRNSVGIGNYKMYGVFRSWYGNLEHWVSSNNQDNGTITKYAILDTRNTLLSDLTYGYRLTLPHINNNGNNQTYDLLGVDKLKPSLTSDGTKLTLNIGGKTTEVTVQQAVSAGTLTGDLYVSYGYDKTNNNDTLTPTENARKDTIETFISGKESTNKIIYDSDIFQITKVKANGASTIGENPKTYDLKISLSTTLQAKINKIATLESTIANLTSRIANLESRNEVVWDNPAT